MIRNITNGYGIHIANNSHSTPYIDSSRPSAGLVRYHSNNLEVYDGSSWLAMQPSYPQVELNSVTQEAIEWVRRKMEQEKIAQLLAEKHTAVADALDAVALAEQQLKTVVALCTV